MYRSRRNLVSCWLDIHSVLRRMAAVVCAVVLSVGLCGCAGSSDGADGGGDSGGARLASSLRAYAAQLLEEDDGSMGAEQRDILQRAAESGEVSVSDYEAAWQRYQTCVVDKGYDRPELATYTNGIHHTIGSTLTEEQSTDQAYLEKMGRDDGSCRDTYVRAVNEIYMAQVGNPNLYADHDEGAVDCLRRGGLAPKSYTVEDYREDQDKAAHKSDGEELDTGIDMDDPEVMACMAANGYMFIDPSAIGGAS
ncbi:hypothetical protein BLEM_2169 [Bifidobacterium lemurum]|uniref:Uncharacterized protein n=2 Tax=Bifidobacterium lemurum TaxID=1603886 RepID=A0A261FLG0_9BIFI|nr:hypothetical protein BLEM_2169 [Bifidobacterium lemurum]